MLSDDSFLYLLAPWKTYAPGDLSHYMNPLLSDVAQYHYAWDVYVRHALHSGSIPIWNPYVLSGVPFYTNSQNGLTALFNLPLWLLPLNYALGLVAWLKLWVGAVGAYLLARQLRLGFWPGLLAGVCFGLCSFNVDWLEHQTLPASSVWLPWLVLAVERLLHRRRLADVLWLALATALAIDGGHPGTEVQVAGAAVLYAVLRACTMQGAERKARMRGVLLAAGGMTLGAMLMAFVVVPVIVGSPETVGKATRAGGGFSLPFSALRSLLFPGWWGRPSEGNYLGPVNYVERTTYAGAIGLLLAVLAVSVRSGWRRKLPFVAIGIVGAAVEVDAPVIHWIVVHLPLFSSVQDARMLFWADFAVAMLAAFGLQSLIDWGAEARRHMWAVLGAGGLVALVAAVGVNPSLHILRTTVNHFRTGNEYHEAKILALTAIGWWLIFLALVTLAILAHRRRWLSGRSLAVVLVLGAAVDMYHFAAGFQPMGPLPRAIPRSTPAIAFLQRNVGISRVVGLTEGDGPYSSLVAEANMNYGLREPTGAEPPLPTLRYFHLWQLAFPEVNPTFGLDVLQVTPQGLQAFDVLGVRYVVTSPTAARVPDLPVVYHGPDLTVYMNPGAVNPAFVPGQVRTVAGERDALAAIAARGFDARREAVVEKTQSTMTTPPAGRGTVQVDDDENSTVRMTARMTLGGLVVLDDSWAKGWSVRVDGRATAPLRVDDDLRGVQVPAGTHAITWSYAVPGLPLGEAVSILALLLMLGGTATVALRRRRTQ